MKIKDMRSYLMEMIEYYNKQAIKSAYSDSPIGEAHNKGKKLLCIHLIEKIDNELNEGINYPQSEEMDNLYWLYDQSGIEEMLNKTDGKIIKRLIHD